MTGPTVSVVVAAYKAGEFLREAVASALAQTQVDLEIIVSDDADDSDVVELVKSFNDPRVRYRSNSTRLGPAGNHWAAFRTARGCWVAILNHDDRWEPTFLSRVMDAVSEVDDAVVGFCDHNVIDGDGRWLAQTNDLSRKYGRDLLSPGRQAKFAPLVLRQTIPLAMGAVFKRSALGDLSDLPDDVGPAYDLWLIYLLAKAGGSAVYISERLTSWRAHAANQTSACGLDWLSGRAKCWAEMASDPAFGGRSVEFRRRAAEAYRSVAKYHLFAGNRPDSRLAASKSFRVWPSLRSAIILGLGILPTKAIRLMRRT